MTLIICSLASLPDVVAQRQPSHLITLLGPDWMIDELGEVGPADTCGSLSTTSTSRRQA